MKTGPANPERSFGVSVGLVLCAIAATLAWRGHGSRAGIAGSVGLVLLVCGLVYPTILSVPSAHWWRFSRVLGQVNARILLTLMFALLFVPLSLLWRLTGTDPLARRRPAGGTVDASPGWLPYPTRYRDKHHYRRMF